MADMHCKKRSPLVHTQFDTSFLHVTMAYSKVIHYCTRISNMVDNIWIPQKNLEDFCRIYAGLTNGTMTDHASFTTWNTPGFFYCRNFIKEDPKENISDIADQIITNTKNGTPHLTTYTKELLPADTADIFYAKGFETLLTQYGMLFEKGTAFDTTTNDHISIISEDELPAWTDTMIEGFVEDNKQREDVIYENLIRDPDTFFLAYRMEEKIVGTAILYLTDDFPGIAEVAVPRPYRGNKIATSLIRRILQMVHEYEKPGVTLQASPLGRPVYQSLGFQQVSEIHTIKLRQ